MLLLVSTGSLPGSLLYLEREQQLLLRLSKGSYRCPEGPLYQTRVLLLPLLLLPWGSYPCPGDAAGDESARRCCLRAVSWFARYCC